MAAALIAPVAGLCLALAGLAAGPARAAPTEESRAPRCTRCSTPAGETLMQAYPGWATSVGDHRYGDRLDDASPGAIAARFAATRRTLAQARAFDGARLSAQDRASLEVFIHQLEEELRFEAWTGYRSLSLGALGGFHTSFAGLLAESPVDNAPQARQVLARMAAYPKRVEQEVALLREGLARTVESSAA